MKFCLMWTAGASRQGYISRGQSPKVSHIMRHTTDRGVLHRDFISRFHSEPCRQVGDGWTQKSNQFNHKFLRRFETLSVWQVSTYKLPRCYNVSSSSSAVALGLGTGRFSFSEISSTCLGPLSSGSSGMDGSELLMTYPGRVACMLIEGAPELR